MSDSDRAADDAGIRQALLESDARYRFLAENLPVQIWTALPDGRLDYVTERTARAFGLTTERLLNEGWQAVVHPEDLPRAIERWTHALKTGETYEVEFRLKLADGTYVPHLARAVPQRDAGGAIVRWLGTNTDLGEQGRQRAERQQLLRELEAKQAMLDSIIQQMPAGIIAAEAPTGKLLFSNELFAQIVAQPAAQATALADSFARGSCYPDGRSYPPEELPLVRSMLRGEVSLEEEVHFRRQDGSTVVLHCNSNPVRDKSGAIIAGITVFRDVTASKKLEEQRDELLAQEQAARGEAELAIRTKDEFLAVASHELRTPLNAILGWARLLRNGQLDQAGYFRAIETIERNAKAQVQLIDDILDGSQIITGNLQLEIRPIDLEVPLRAVLDAVRPAAEAKQIAVTVAVEPDATRMLGDPDRLQQVMWNLASNAIKFTPKGGTVDLRLQREGSHIELSVKDSGQGISPEFIPYVFDRFRQAEGSTVRRHGGLGLGLALVRHLVEAHGGTVAAESAGDGLGATFRITLPVQAVLPKITATPERERSPAEDTFRGGLTGVRVLVVDDEPDARELVSMVLRAGGAEVLVAASAAQGLAVLAAMSPLVVVSDVGMPDTDGYSLMRQIRALPDPANSKLRAVALTAYAREEDRRRALEAGFNTHVAKPVEPEELVRVVAKLAREAQAQLLPVK